MSTVEQLEQALAKARQLGFSVREEWLGGNGGGDCEIGGKRWIFLDVADGAADQLACVLAAIERAGGAHVHLGRGERRKSA